MRFKYWPLITTFVISVSANLWAAPAALAQHCDPAAFKDTEKVEYNFSLWLAYVSNLVRNHKQDDSSSFGISYLGIGLSYADAHAAADFISQQKSYSLGAQESQSIYRTTLTGNDLSAYVACLKTGGVEIRIPDGAIDQDGFLLSVVWDPQYRTTQSEYPLRVLVKNGKVDGNSDQKIHPKDTIPLSLSRPDLTKKLFVSATVNGQADTVVLPERPGFVMKLRERVTPDWSVIRDGGHGTDYVSKDLCVTSNPDSILLPSTGSFVGVKIGDQRRIVNEPAKTNNSNRYCGTVGASTGCNECTISVSGHFSVFEAYLEDRTTATLSKADAPHRIPVK